MAAGDDEEAEQAVYREFMQGSMALLDAIEALTRIGYDKLEAERVVFEWIDGEEDEDQDELI